MKLLGAVSAALTVAFLATGCATAPPQACNAGQERVRTAQLFFGLDAPGEARVSDRDFRDFMDNELTPRFPNGLTVLDGGSQWDGSADRLIREASKVVLIVLPASKDARERVEAARNAYRARFHQEPALLVGRPNCMTL